MVEVKREKGECQGSRWCWAEPVGPYWPSFVNWFHSLREATFGGF